MFGHKSFLKLGMLSDASIMGLYKESYELESCSYGFSQGINTDGKAQTEVRGGCISVAIPGIPAMDIIQWAIDSRKYNDGVLVICDDNDMALEKINFQDAACIGMEINYSQKGKGYIATKLTLQVRKMTVGDTELNNRWTGFDD
ncbi:MAG: type VI secretion system needle protein Hcp [Bacteroides sp.]|nr:type VI secretion system needle protein Hcp [Bacteroides sp.]MCD8031686.1 type VI secretion system needle protein Hcp [Bacteroides sp.]